MQGGTDLFFPITVVVVVAFTVGAIAGAVSGLWSRKRHWAEWRLVHGLCPACGYDLTGNVSGVCPECGTPLGR